MNRLIKYFIMIFIISTINSNTIIAQNHAPVISPNFPDTVITKQGISNIDSIFAVPLNEFGYDADYDSLIWSTLTEDSIVTFFSTEQGTLFVHSQANWYGRGSFTLKLEDKSEAFDEKEITVVCFKKDGTILSEDGKKTEYYIPWHPQLDFNRIASVEEHMAKYNKQDTGLLNREINWSRWEKMEYIKGAQIVGWMNEQVLRGWKKNAQYFSVDYTCDELRLIHCNGINYWRSYYLETQESPYPIEIFDRYMPHVSITDEDLRYIINEAHLKGLKVIITPHVNEPPGEGRGGFNPPDFDVWFIHYGNIIEKNAQICMETGADGFVVGNILYIPVTIFYYQRLTNDEWNQYIIDIHDNIVRTCYKGPTLYTPGCYEFVDYRNIIPLLDKVDIVGGNSNFNNYPVDNNPTVEQVENHITNGIKTYIDPLHKLLNKPFIMNEGGMSSFDGAIKLHDSSGKPFPPNAKYDGEEQAIWYQAYFNSEKKFDFIFGFGWFYWLFGPGHGGKGDRGGKPRLKPAEKVIEKTYGGYISPRLIDVDGIFDDWKPHYLIASDTVGDSKSERFDLNKLYGIMDEMYAYIMVEFIGALDTTDIILYSFDINGDDQADIPGGIMFDVSDGWTGLLNEKNMNYDELRGIMIVVSDTLNSKFEFAIPMRLFDYILNLGIQVAIVDTKTDTIIDEINGFHIIHLKEPSNVLTNDKLVKQKSFELLQNYPNPFNSETIIEYKISYPSKISLKILNLIGQEIITLIDEYKFDGIYQQIWNGNNKNGNAVPSGMYFIILENEKTIDVKKLVLIH